MQFKKAPRAIQERSSINPRQLLHDMATSHRHPYAEEGEALTQIPRVLRSTKGVGAYRQDGGHGNQEIQ